MLSKRDKPILFTFFLLIIGGYYFVFLGIKKLDAVPINLTNEKAINFVEDGWAFQLGRSKEEILRNLGKPNKIKSERYDNPYYQEDDTIYNYYYSGLQVRFSELSSQAGGRLVLLYLVVYSNCWPLKLGIKIGMSKEKIISILGNTYIEHDSKHITYEQQADSVEFMFKDNKLEKVEWYFYAG